MNIYPVNLHQQTFPQRNSFKGNNKFVCDVDTGNTYKTTTYFFRKDLDWDGFIDLIDEKYKNTDKVHVYNEACSSGHEPISLAIKLREHFGDNAKKFHKIHARDVDTTNIYHAKKGLMSIKLSELYDIDIMSKGCYRNYLSYNRSPYSFDDISLSPKPIIINDVDFKQGDIFDDIESMPSSNTIVLARNFWRYLPKTGNNAEKLANMMGEKFDKSCLIVIGEHDRECYTPELLKNAGFIETRVPYVYEKQK